MTELKPCPFCGGEATLKLAPYIGGGGFGYIIDCDKCWSRTGYYSKKTEAIAAWNTRAHKPFVLMNGVAFCCECGTCIGRHDDHYSECPSCGAKVATKDFSLCNYEEVQRLVRCKDCRFYIEDSSTCWYFGHCELVGLSFERVSSDVEVESDGFCAWGKRKEVD